MLYSDVTEFSIHDSLGCFCGVFLLQALALMPTTHLQKLTSKRIAFRQSWLRIVVIPGQVLLTPVSVQDARTRVY